MVRNFKELQSSRIGEKILSWTIIGCLPGSRNAAPTRYKFRCECGNITLDVYHRRTKKKCKICSNNEKFKTRVGETVGYLKIIGFERKNNLPYFKIKCRCSNEYWTKTNCLTTSENCRKCRDEIFPGKTIGGWKILENLNGTYHKIECVFCGKIEETIIRASRIKTCSCVRERSQTENALKKIGQKYKYLKVSNFIGKEDGHLIFEMKCVCGKKFLRKNGHLFKSQSCGCKNKESLPVGENASNATFKNIEIRFMREMYDSGNYSFSDICEMYKDKDPHYINRILKRQVWKSLE